jgi:hypothetical protein
VIVSSDLRKASTGWDFRLRVLAIDTKSTPSVIHSNHQVDELGHWRSTGKENDWIFRMARPAQTYAHAREDKDRQDVRE